MASSGDWNTIQMSFDDLCRHMGIRGKALEIHKQERENESATKKKGHDGDRD